MGELVIEPVFTTEELLIRSLFATEQQPPKITKGPKTSVTVATTMSTAAIEAGAAANKIAATPLTCNLWLIVFRPPNTHATGTGMTHGQAHRFISGAATSKLVESITNKPGLPYTFPELAECHSISRGHLIETCSIQYKCTNIGRGIKLKFHRTPTVDVKLCRWVGREVVANRLDQDSGKIMGRLTVTASVTVEQ